MMEIVPPLCRLTDLGSRNRTQINGQVLEKNQSRSVGERRCHPRPAARPCG